MSRTDIRRNLTELLRKVVDKDHPSLIEWLALARRLSLQIDPEPLKAARLNGAATGSAACAAHPVAGALQFGVAGTERPRSRFTGSCARDIGKTTMQKDR